MIREEGQIIRYKNLIVELDNREFFTTDNNLLGFSKELQSLPSIESIDLNNRGIDRIEKVFYNLEWDLFITFEKYFLLTEIVKEYNRNLNSNIENSSYLYDNISYIDTVDENIYLEDFRIKDYLTSSFATYRIQITELLKIDEVYFDKQMAIIKIKGVTL